MRLQRFTDYLLGHRWQALILTFLVTYIPVVGMAGILIAALMTLSVGITEGGIFTLAATLPFALVSFIKTPETNSAVMHLTVIFAITSNLLTWALAVLLRRGWKWSSILQA